MELARSVEAEIQGILLRIRSIQAGNQLKVLAAFQAARISPFHFAETTGYGLDDPGRAALEDVFRRVFGTEAALVRPGIVSGTHAIALCLFGILRPGDRLVSLTGRPYDTLLGVIGPGTPGSLAHLGVEYREGSCLVDGRPDGALLARLLDAPADTRVLAFIQRSGGYGPGPGVDPRQAGELARLAAAIRPGTVTLVDNCYGEFTELQEPTETGASLVAGSLIKNPGGGLAPAGGYVAGPRELVELAAVRLTAPGLGSAVGASPPGARLLFQGLYLAPTMVGTALANAVFAARFFERLGLPTRPAWNHPRTDIVQEITLGSRPQVLAFLRGIQQSSPVDAAAAPEPGPLPGYADPVAMAAGTFVQGATLELSADSPLRPPFNVYLQGGLVREQASLACMLAAQEMGLGGPA
ncbi:MAG: methionine gamma-lyase family protein [bacterium]|nr:methionine gamma-lyase family protein [bacterium]